MPFTFSNDGHSGTTGTDRNSLTSAKPITYTQVGSAQGRFFESSVTTGFPLMMKIVRARIEFSVPYSQSHTVDIHKTVWESPPIRVSLSGGRQ
jgi:hypothetical protein